MDFTAKAEAVLGAKGTMMTWDASVAAVEAALREAYEAGRQSVLSQYAAELLAIRQMPATEPGLSGRHPAPDGADPAMPFMKNAAMRNGPCQGD